MIMNRNRAVLLVMRMSNGSMEDDGRLRVSERAIAELYGVQAVGDGSDSTDMQTLASVSPHQERRKK